MQVCTRTFRAWISMYVYASTQNLRIYGTLIDGVKYIVILEHCCYMWAGIAHTLQLFATERPVRGSNACVGEIFYTRPDRFWGSLSLLCHGYLISFRGKVVRAWRQPLTLSRAEVKEIWNYTSKSPSVPSMTGYGANFQFYCCYNFMKWAASFADSCS